MTQKQLNVSLIKFSKLGCLGAIKFLVENGADIHYLDELALVHSACNGRLDTVKYLLEKGARKHTAVTSILRITSYTEQPVAVAYFESLWSKV